MSMILQLARLSTEDYERVREQPARLTAVFQYHGDGDLDDVRFLWLDYRPLPAFAERLGTALDNPNSWLARALGVGLGEHLAYEAGYGPAFALSSADVEHVVAGLRTERWAGDVTELEREVEDDTLSRLIRFFETAASEHDGIVGIVS